MERLVCWKIMLVIATVIMVTDGQTPICPGGTLRHNDTECWVFQSTPTKWSDAHSTCDSLGGNLAEAYSIEDHDFLETVQTTEGVAYMWLGGLEVGDPGFTWTASYEATWTYKWATGEPDGNGDCVAVETMAGDKFTADDCNNLYPYICEVPLNVTYCEASPDRFYSVRFCYFVSSVKATWYGAHKACVDTYGGFLVSLEDKEIYDFYTKVNGPYTGNQYWTGLRRSHWAWYSAEPMLFTNWAAGQPGSGVDGCLAMSAPLGYNWDNQDCTAANSYVCVISPTVIYTTQEPVVCDVATAANTDKILDYFTTLEFGKYKCIISPSGMIDNVP